MNNPKQRNDKLPNGVADKKYYDNVKKQQKLMYCDDCKFEWLSGDTNIQTVVVANKDDMDVVYKVIYFDCPNCHKRYLVSVDNKKTESMKEVLHELEGKIQRYAKRNKNLFGNNKTSFVFDMMVKQRDQAIKDIINEQNNLKVVYTELMANGLAVEV